VFLQLVKRHAAEIFTSVIVATLFSLYSTALVGRLVGLEPTLTVSIIPRCITVALALSIVSFFEGIVMFRSQLEAGNSINGHPLVMLKLNFDISNTVILR
jgi:putative effector of murein hydrolase